MDEIIFSITSQKTQA